MIFKNTGCTFGIVAGLIPSLCFLQEKSNAKEAASGDLFESEALSFELLDLPQVLANFLGLDLLLGLQRRQLGLSILSLQIHTYVRQGKA